LLLHELIGEDTRCKWHGRATKARFLAIQERELACECLCSMSVEKNSYGTDKQRTISKETVLRLKFDELEGFPPCSVDELFIAD